jgi:hypothetical protein
MQAIQRITTERGAAVDAPFRRDAVGWILAALNALSAANSTYAFLALLKVGIVGWLMMNTCAPGIALFVLGYALASPVVLTTAAVLMLRYGTVGLFVFGWEGINLIAQMGHIVMTLAAVYVGYRLIRERRWRALAVGAGIGAALLAGLALAQGAWFSAHPGMLEMLFSGDYGPPAP